MSQFFVSSSSSSSGGVTTITGNTGGPVTPVAGNINIVTANTTVQFSGSGNTETEDFGLSNLLMGSAGTLISGATLNVGVGLTALSDLTSGTNNTAVGALALKFLTSGIHNTCVGQSAGMDITTGSSNTAVGYSALSHCTTGAANAGSNTAIGEAALSNITTGIINIGIGSGAGTNYASSESSNICIGNVGVLSESNVIRIGTQGSSTGQQTDCYLAGVLRTSSGRIVKVTTPGAYPYTALTTDYLILVDTTSARIINLLAAPETGRTYVIKDVSGTSSINNITVQGNGSNIDGSATYVINSNYASITVIYNGTTWSIV